MEQLLHCIHNFYSVVFFPTRLQAPCPPWYPLYTSHLIVLIKRLMNTKSFQNGGVSRVTCTDRNQVHFVRLICDLLVCTEVQLSILPYIIGFTGSCQTLLFIGHVTQKSNLFNSSVHPFPNMQSRDMSRNSSSPQGRQNDQVRKGVGKCYLVDDIP